MRRKEGARGLSIGPSKRAQTLTLVDSFAQGDASPKCSCAWVRLGDAIRKSKPQNPHPNQHRIDNHQSIAVGLELGSGMIFAPPAWTSSLILAYGNSRIEPPDILRAVRVWNGQDAY